MPFFGQPVNKEKVISHWETFKMASFLMTNDYFPLTIN